MDTTTHPIIALKSLAGNAPTHLVPMQVFLLEHFDFVEMLWRALWVCVVVILCFKLAHEYLQHRKTKRTGNKNGI